MALQLPAIYTMLTPERHLELEAEFRAHQREDAQPNLATDVVWLGSLKRAPVETCLMKWLPAEAGQGLHAYVLEEVVEDYRDINGGAL